MNAEQIIEAGTNAGGKVADFTMAVETNHAFGTDAGVVLDDLRGALGEIDVAPEVVAFFAKLGVTA